MEFLMSALGSNTESTENENKSPAKENLTMAIILIGSTAHLSAIGGIPSIAIKIGKRNLCSGNYEHFYHNYVSAIFQMYWNFYPN